MVEMFRWDGATFHLLPEYLFVSKPLISYDWSCFVQNLQGKFCTKKFKLEEEEHWKKNQDQLLHHLPQGMFLDPSIAKKKKKYKKHLYQRSNAYKMS